jgi:hypothetical protein
MKDRQVPMRRRCAAYVLAVGWLVGATHAAAQTTGGAFAGRVHDQSGGALPYAQIAITNVATGVETSVVTNDQGVYAVPNLLPGLYNVAASFDGFNTEVRKGITLMVGGDVVVDFVMKVGDINESILVAGQASTVNVTSATLQHNVSGTTIRELPLNGRDWTQLAILQPGVVGVNTSSGARQGNGLKMAVAGARPSENNYRLNGIGVNDYANTTPGNALGTNLGVEAVQEFTVLTNSYSAEYGRTTGGVINAITRSGTNQLHGTIFEFHRNSAMDTKDYFDTGSQPPPFHRNQYGVAAGGPLLKNRTFWFADYEGLREQLSTTTISTTPSANARLGRLAAGQVNVDPMISKVLGLYPLPNAGLLGNGDTGQFSTVREKKSRADYALVRLDHTVSKAGRLNSTYLYDDASFNQPDALLNKLERDSSNRHVLMGEYSHVFGPAVVNVNRFGVSRTSARSGIIAQVYNPLLTDPSLGYIPGYNMGTVSIPGLTGVGGGPGSVDPTILDFTSYQFSEDLYYLKGKHSLKFGANLEYMQNDFEAPNLTGGSFNFGTLAGFLQNRPTRFGTLFPNSDTTRRMRQTLLGGYVQDDFRWADTLTLNLGLRYEMMTIPTEVDNKVALLKGLTDPTVTVGAPIHDSNPTLLNFAPRVGMAWDPFGEGKTSVRAGFGMFDVLPFLYLYTTPMARSTPLFVQGVTLNPPAGSFPGGALSLLGVQNLRTAWVDPNPPRAYRQQWNAGVQQQIGGWMADVAYVGSRGQNLPLVERNMNTVIPTLVNGRWVYPPRSQSQILNPNFASINTTVTWNAEAEYHGLQATVKRNLSAGLLVQASHTYGKSVDTGSSISSTSAGAGYDSAFSVATPLLPEIGRGPSNFDVRHNFVGSVVWEIPSPSSLSGLTRVALADWQISGVFRAQSGFPFTLALNGDRAGSKADTTGSGLGQPPDVIDSPECRSLTNPGNVKRYVKLECFTFPAEGVLGNLQRNVLTAPGLATLDLVLVKNQRLRGGTTAQIRIEMFNALDRANFSVPNVIIYDNTGNLTANVGVITSTRTSARQMQLGVKFLW